MEPTPMLARRSPRAVVGAGLLALIVASWSCAGVRWISDYDETTDKSLTALQQTTDDLVSLLEKNQGTAVASLDAIQGDYDEIDRRLRRLEFRVASIPKNDSSKTLVADIRAAILGNGACSPDGASLRDLHCLPDNKADGPSIAALEIARRNINTTIFAALRLELAKKQGTVANR